MGIEQPQGEYRVTIAFLNLLTTLVRVSAAVLAHGRSAAGCHGSRVQSSCAQHSSPVWWLSGDHWVTLTLLFGLSLHSNFFQTLV